MTQQPPATPNYQQSPQGSNGMAIASLVLGILAILLVCVPFVSFVLAVLAIVLGALSMSKPVGAGMAKTGLILGIVAVILKIIVMIVVAFFIRKGHGYFQQKADEIQKKMDAAQKQAEEAQKKEQEQLQHQQQNPLTQPSGSAITPMQWRLPSLAPGMAPRTLYLVLPNCA